VGFTNLADIQLRGGGSSVTAALFDDDGDGVPDPTVVTVIADEATAAVKARLLLKGFTGAQLDLLADDPIIRGYATDIALGIAGRRRPEFIDREGRGRYDAVERNAKAELDLHARSLLRFPDESVAGAQTSPRGQFRAPVPALEFNSSTDNPRGRGGF